MACTHGCDNALDPTYVPTADEDKAIFKLQNTFMYLIWDYILLTDKGKEIVMEH
jgi:hypothetical protein